MGDTKVKVAGNRRHGRGAAKEAGSTAAWGGRASVQASRHGSGQGFAGCHWGRARRCWFRWGTPGWANRVSLPLQQTGATRTIVSNPRLDCSALLCAYPSPPARQTLDTHSQTLDTPNKSDSLRHLPALAHDEACSAHPYPLQLQQRPPAARLAAMTGRPSPCSVVHTHCQFLACPITARSARCCSSAARRSPIVSHAGLITLEAALSTPSQSPPPALSLMPAVSTRCSTHTR